MTRMKFFIAGMIIVAGTGTVSFFLQNEAPKTTLQENTSDTQVTTVTVKPARNLTTLVTEETIPAIIVPENEAVLVAETSGTISSISVNVGEKVSVGDMFARIESPEKSTVSKSGLQSETIRQAEIAVSLAKKSYKEAKRLAEKNSSKENSLARDLAKLRLESSEINLANTLDSSIVRSPVSGIVSEKNVSTGSSVSPGTLLIKVVSGNTTKVHFYVSDTTRRSLEINKKIPIILHDASETSSIIVSIGTIADPNTGKFPIEARLEENTVAPGTVANALIQTTVSSQEKSGIFLPLSAITIGQESSFFFIADNNRAKKIPITSETVFGESVFVSTEIPADASVIIENTGTLEDGMAVKTQ